MKSTVFAFLFSSFALTTVGQHSGRNIPSSGKRSPHASSVMWENKNLFSFVRTAPLGDWTKVANSYGNIKNGQAGMVKGFGVAYGQVFYLQQNDRINPGIDVTYFDVSAYNTEGSDSEADWSFMGSFKIGPVISANPIDQLILDIKFTIQPSYIYYQRTYGSAESSSGSSHEEYDNIWGDGFLLRTGAAFQIRYNWLMVGMEYSWGDGDFAAQNEDYYVIQDWTGWNLTSNLDETSLNFKTNRLDVYLGFCF